jgi:hypothetical protein
MSWTATELERIGHAEEFELASRGDDGELSAYVTMWVVRVGEELFVRSAGGPSRPWYRRAKAAGGGRIRAGVVERDVTFEEAPFQVIPRIDAAYHEKYDSYGATIVGHVTGGASHLVSIRLVPDGRSDADQ